MSFSRYSHSRWYTYWASSDATEPADEVFVIAGVREFTYGMIKSDINMCLQVVWEQCSDVTDAELEELGGYMMWFVWTIEMKYTGRIQDSD